MARVINIGLAAACAVSLAGCNFIRDDINRTLGHSPEDRTRHIDLAASQVTTAHASMSNVVVLSR